MVPTLVKLLAVNSNPDQSARTQALHLAFVIVCSISYRRKVRPRMKSYNRSCAARISILMPSAVLEGLNPFATVGLAVATKAGAELRQPATEVPWWAPKRQSQRFPRKPSALGGIAVSWSMFLPKMSEA
jgi:hypothetical protein